MDPDNKFRFHLSNTLTLADKSAKLVTSAIRLFISIPSVAPLTDIFYIQKHLAFDIILGCQFIDQWNLCKLNSLSLSQQLSSSKPNLSAVLQNDPINVASDRSHISLAPTQKLIDFEQAQLDGIDLRSIDSEIIDDESPSTLDASVYAPLTHDNLAALNGHSDSTLTEDNTDSDGISSISVYRHVRVPFGMKGSPSHFQRMV